MKSFFRYLAVVLLVVTALGFTGCKEPQKRQKPDPVEIVSIDKVEGSVAGKWIITATVANNTAFNLRINDVAVFIKDENRKIVNISTDEVIALPRRKHTQVTIPLNVAVSRSISSIAALNNLRKGLLSKIKNDYSAIVKAMGSKITIKEENVSLEELNKRFNLGLKSVK